MHKQHELFCTEYVRCGDGETAAMVAGYALATLGTTADRLLAIQGIRDRIEELGGTPPPLETKTIPASERRQRIFEEWCKVAFVDIRKMFDDYGHLLPIKRMPADIAACVASFEVERGVTKVKMVDKMKALESLARSLQMFAELGKKEDSFEGMTTEELTKLVEESYASLKNGS